jgi:hypothetical protein
MAEPTSPPPGFYSDETGRRRWWDGTGWTNQFVEPGGAALDGRLTPGERRAILDRAVARFVRNGYTVESNTGTQAVVAKRQRISWLPNILLAIVTGGLWLVVLAIKLIDWPRDRAVLTIDASGELQGEFSS